MKFLNRDVYQSVEDAVLDETLNQYIDVKELNQEVVLIMLKGHIGEGIIGAGNLFDQGALCLIESESDLESSTLAYTLLSTGKGHLELGISEMGEFIELFLKHPEEVKTFFMGPDPHSPHSVITSSDRCWTQHCSWQLSHRYT